MSSKLLVLLDQSLVVRETVSLFGCQQEVNFFFSGLFNGDFLLGILILTAPYRVNPGTE